MKPKVLYQELSGVTFLEAWDMQTVIHEEMKRKKLAWRDLSKEERSGLQQLNHLLFCEHKPVYTLGKSGSIDHLLYNDDQLAAEKIEYFKINRGGDITYHGPGQLTGYPILDLDEFFTDVHKYVRYLEEAVIQLLATYDIEGYREEGFTGVWLQPNDRFTKKRKICAIGVHLSRWVTMHGFALNINTDIRYFENIIPCGIQEDDKEVTSMEIELGRNVSMDEVKTRLKSIFATLFDFEYINEV